MSPLDPLAPDQRAVVSLVLQQGRSYDEIAALLGIPAAAVAERAHAGLATLAHDDGLPAAVTQPLADYLLGQQPPEHAAATRRLLGESAPARAWASSVAGALADVAARPLPAIPDGAPEVDQRPAAEPAAPRPRPLREPAPAGAGAGDAPAASRIGGALLIAAVVAVVAIVLFLVLRSGDDGGGAGAEQAATATPAASATATATSAPQVADRIPLRSPAGGKARGTMTVYLQDGRLLFELIARKVPPNGDRAAYAVWFTGPGDRAHRLGFTSPVGADGKLGIQGPSASDADAFPKQYATYADVIVSRETDENAARPGPAVLSGRLPKGRQ